MNGVPVVVVSIRRIMFENRLSRPRGESVWIQGGQDTERGQYISGGLGTFQRSYFVCSDYLHSCERDVYTESC